MRTPSYAGQFRRDLRRLLKRGKDPAKFKELARLLIAEEKLPARYREHKLKGSFSGRHECHLEPDWLVVYKLLDDEIIFERSGAHSDLFD